MLQQETQGLVCEVERARETRRVISPYALSALWWFHFHGSCAGDRNKRKCLKIPAHPPTKCQLSETMLLWRGPTCCMMEISHNAVQWLIYVQYDPLLLRALRKLWFACSSSLLDPPPPHHLQYCRLLTLHAADYNCWRCDSLLVLGDNKICCDDNQHRSLFYLCIIFLVLYYILEELLKKY